MSAAARRAPAAAAPAPVPVAVVAADPPTRSEIQNKEHTMNKTTPILAALLALGFSFGAAQAQTTGASGSATGTGSSATGGQAAPAAQPGTGTRNTPAKKDDKVAR